MDIVIVMVGCLLRFYRTIASITTELVSAYERTSFVYPLERAEKSSFSMLASIHLVHIKLVTHYVLRPAISHFIRHAVCVYSTSLTFSIGCSNCVVLAHVCPYSMLSYFKAIHERIV